VWEETKQGESRVVTGGNCKRSSDHRGKKKGIPGSVMRGGELKPATTTKGNALVFMIAGKGVSQNLGKGGNGK